MASPPVSQGGDPLSHPLETQPVILSWDPPAVKRVLDVPPGEAGLKLLALQGCWRAVLERLKASRTAPPGAPEMLRCTAYKVLALCKTRQYSAAFDELNSLGGLDSAQYIVEGPGGTTVSLVPFALRWLSAQLPGLLGRQQYTMDELYKLLDLCGRKEAEAINAATTAAAAGQGTGSGPAGGDSAAAEATPSTATAAAAAAEAAPGLGGGSGPAGGDCTAAEAVPPAAAEAAAGQGGGSGPAGGDSTAAEPSSTQEEEGGNKGRAAAAAAGGVAVPLPPFEGEGGEDTAGGGGVDEGVSAPADVAKWRRRREVVMHTLVNYHVRNKEYLPALLLCNQLLQRHPDSHVLWCRVAGVQLLAGDVAAAAKTVEKVAAMVDASGLPEGSEQRLAAEVEARVARGLLLFAQNNSEGAIREFNWVLERSPGGHLVAANNRSVATMYGCDTGGAIRQMEEQMAAHPLVSLQEPFMLNMSSLYELHASDYRDEARHKISVWVSRCGPEDFDTSVFRSL